MHVTFSPELERQCPVFISVQETATRQEHWAKICAGADAFEAALMRGEDIWDEEDEAYTWFDNDGGLRSNDDDDFEPLQLLTHLNRRPSPRMLHLPPAPPVRGKTSIWDVLLHGIAGGVVYFGHV